MIVGTGTMIYTEVIQYKNTYTTIIKTRIDVSICVSFWKFKHF